MRYLLDTEPLFELASPTGKASGARKFKNRAWFSSKNILCQQSGQSEKLDPILVRFQEAEPGNSSLKFPRIYFDAV